MIIATKLAMPRPPPMALDRRRLDRLLDAGMDGPLTVIVAPAGYGKTVAATSHLTWDLDRTSAWVSLDSSDDEPARFWTYVVEALTGAGMEMAPAGSPVERLELATPGDVLAPLINAIADMAVDVTLAIDDLHLITSPDIHRQLAFLVEQRLRRLHLLLLTRTDPPLLTARLLASGRAVRVGVRDLAFDRDETTAFLVSQDLDAGLGAVVFDRLGGWPAALRLLTLWIAGQDDPEHAVARFARSDEIVADYLASEVLGQLDPELRRFLVTTSILGRLSGPLCDAVSGTDGATRILVELHRRGLFVDAIDSERGWFRYHHLFAELLGRELRSLDQPTIDDLHRRASAWFAANGHGDEAIGHAIAARDWDGLHRLLLTELLAIGNRYHFAIIESWLAAVPSDIRSTSAIYLLLDGFVLASTGRLDAARDILEQGALRSDDAGAATVAALIVTVQAGIARLDADLPMAHRLVEAAEDHLGELDDDPNGHARLARVATNLSLAATQLWHGDTTGADRRFTTMETVATRHDMGRMQVNATAGRSFIAAAVGRLARADALAQQALQLAAPVGVLDSFQTNPAHLAVALSLQHRGDHLAARRAFLAAAERSQRHGDRAPTALAHLCLAHLAHLAHLPGDLALVASHLDAITNFWPTWTPPAPLAAWQHAARGRLLLALDDVPGARAHYDALEAHHRHHPDGTLAAGYLGALLVARNDPDRGALAFEALAEFADAGGQPVLAIASYLDAGINHHRNGDPTAARHNVGVALEAACREGIRGPFLERTVAVRTLLLASSEPGTPPAQAFCQQLLRDLGVPTEARPGPGRPIDQLTDRERTVHRLLASRMSNAEIALTLDITPNTLKTHVRNIYRKLGVNSRPGAISTAT